MSMPMKNLLEGSYAPIEVPDDVVGAAIENTRQALFRSIRIGVIVIGGLLILFAAMASLINVNGAVIAQGQLSTEVAIQQVSHPTGGVIEAVLVREGQHVRSGQPIIRLESTLSGAGANAAHQSVQQLLAAAARMRAERDGSRSITFPPELLDDRSPEAALAMAEARQMFSVRRSAEASSQAQIREQLAQTRNEIKALEAEGAAARDQIKLIEPELAGLRSLKARGLVTVGRLNQMERAAIDLRSTKASVSARIAQSRARLAELRQAGIQSAQTARAAAAADLVPVLSQLSDQNLRAASAKDAYDRSVIRAPHAGFVENLRFTTLGSAIPPMQPVVEIVPDGGSLMVDLRIPPQDIESIHRDQIATVRLASVTGRNVSDMVGRVTHISSRRFIDERTGESYYKATVEIGESERRLLGDQRAIVGMPLEIFLQTGERSLLSYLFAPLLQQFNRAFREG
jgi:HlyD family secretion protein